MDEQTISQEELELQEELKAAKEALLQAQVNAKANAEVLTDAVQVVLSGDKAGIKRLVDTVKAIAGPLMEGGVDILDLLLKTYGDVLDLAEAKRISNLRAVGLGRFRDNLIEAGFTKQEAFEFCKASHLKSQDVLSDALKQISSNKKKE